jgi:amino acid adenylation domain-containing protein
MSMLVPDASKLGSSWLSFLKHPSWPKKSSSSAANGTFEGSIPKIVCARACENPGSAAIVAGDRIVSYRNLLTQSDAIANHLHWLGVRPGDVVALLMDRSPSLISAALGVMNAGAAYLPLDPSYPVERISLILEDSRARIVLSSSDILRRIPRASAKPVDVSTIQARGSGSSAWHTPELSPSQLAYVIYTSGSTGRPKGVEITHGNLQNLVQWHLHAFNVSSSDRATLLASPGFDAAVWETWPYLAAGATLYVVDDVTRASPRALRNWMVSKRITISFVPTPVAQRLIFLDWPKESSLRYLLTGADVLQQYPPEGLPFTLVNNYGPTECTVVATSGVVSAQGRRSSRPPIGRPITNCEAYVLNEKLEPVTLGAIGELHISGENVGRGYRNDPELTAEKFIPNPFSKTPGSRLYKTGDLVRSTPSGELEFIGRTDDQIKIRGHRVEPDEVSSMLCKHEAIQSSVVLARRGDSGEPVLAAYLLWKSGYEATSTQLRDHLRAQLPDYMVPNIFVALSSFPLTPNGKIDRSALPQPTSANTLRDNLPSAPRTQTEQQLMGIISQLLGVNGVHPNDNFFMLGGHSLLGAQLLAKIQQSFGIELPLRTVFDYPTVAAISAQIDQHLAGHNGSHPIAPNPDPHGDIDSLSR